MTLDPRLRTPSMIRKQPFLPESRQISNICACAACGSLARGTKQLPGTEFYGPENWVVRTLKNDTNDKTLVFTCDRCVAKGVDGSDATAYYDTHDMFWVSSSSRWEATRVAPEARPQRSEESSMATNGAGTGIEKASIKEKAMGQATALGSAVALGGKLALVDEIGEIMVDIAREFGKDNMLIAGALSDETGREFVKAFGAFLLHSGCTYSDFVPHADKVKYAAELQITASSETLLKPRMKDLRKLFGRLAEIGEKAAALDGSKADAEEEAEGEERAPARRAATR